MPSQPAWHGTPSCNCPPTPLAFIGNPKESDSTALRIHFLSSCCAFHVSSTLPLLCQFKPGT
eukprot:3640981-Amphidinium_carterae.1